MTTAPRLEQITRAMKRQGYRVFDDPDRRGYDLNIVGIRTASIIPDMFDDFLATFWKTGEDRWAYHPFSGTTDPGTYWLENPMVDAGTAILKPGQYRGAYAIGRHQGRYKAFQQVKPMDFYRDGNRDGVLNTAGQPVETAIIGANIHHSGAWRAGKRVGRNSAACQVSEDDIDLSYMLMVAERAAKVWGNSFTYTLLREDEL